MSASTVSLTGGGVTTRRRAVVGGEKKTTTVEFVEEISGGKDLSRSIGGDSVLERSRDHHHHLHPAVVNNKSSSIPPRKSSRKVTKPRWATVASVFGKNFVLLILLLGFVQMIRNYLTTNNHNNHTTTTAHVIDDGEFERRISGTESLLKTTTKMMQAQVEVVDRKIQDQIASLRSELSQNIQDNTLIIQQGFTKIQDRTDALEKSLGEFNFMSKQDFDNFFHEFNKNNDDYSASLDEIRASLKELIEKEFEKHAADGLGRVDYALASGGAVVIDHSQPYIVAKGTSSFWFPSRRNGGGVSIDAYKMLRPSFGEPGQCFPLKGSAGFVQIMLRTPIIPQAFTLEHVSKSVAYDRSSAPKDCRVSGWLQDHNKDAAVEVEMFRLAEFAYDLEKNNNAQTFNVLDTAASGVVNTIRLDFTSNHGSPSHTCIYRFRVHGHEPSSVSSLPMQS